MVVEVGRPPSRERDGGVIRKESVVGKATESKQGSRQASRTGGSGVGGVGDSQGGE